MKINETMRMIVSTARNVAPAVLPSIRSEPSETSSCPWWESLDRTSSAMWGVEDEDEAEDEGSGESGDSRLELLSRRLFCRICKDKWRGK